jgi:hypothetical protein
MNLARSAAVSLVFAATLACGAGRPPSAPVGEVDDAPGDALLGPKGAPISFRRSQVADEYFWLRTKVLEGEAPPAFSLAFAAMHDLRGELAQDPSGWEDLEVPLGEVRSASELLAAYARLPEQRGVGGQTVLLRAAAVRLARAMLDLEGAFRKGPYREHAGEIGRAAEELAARLVPVEPALVRAMEVDLDLPGGARPVVVTLVGEAPYPVTFAADQRGRTMASFVRVRGLFGSALVEVVLQEALHALDEMTVREPTALNALRAALARRGVDADDSNAEMVINVVTLAEAASLVQRFVDPQHRPLGEGGFYKLYPPAPAIVEAWTRHLGRGESLEATADAVARAVTSP